jgi:hypothetical protein
MEEKPVGYGTVYGGGSPRQPLQPITASTRAAIEEAARVRRRAHPVEDPALLGFDPHA